MLTTMLRLLQSYTTLLHVSEEAKSSHSQQPDQYLSIHREFPTSFDFLIAPYMDRNETNRHPAHPRPQRELLRPKISSTQSNNKSSTCTFP